MKKYKTPYAIALKDWKRAVSRLKYVDKIMDDVSSLTYDNNGAERAWVYMTKDAIVALNALREVRALEVGEASKRLLNTKGWMLRALKEWWYVLWV